MKKNNNTSELDDLLANVEDIDFVFEDDTISDTDESDESEEDDLPEDFFDDDSEENDLYEPDGTPKKHSFVVGDKVMTSIFPERFFDSDYEMNTNEKLYIIDCSKEWAQARQEYDNLMEEYYLRTEKANQLTESNNPPCFEVRDEPADKVARIKYRFSSILGDFDKSNTDTIFKDYPVDISRECVSNVIFDKIKSRDIKIRNPLKITGFIEDTAFSYWAVKPIIYHRKVNGRDELFNYYEIYTRNNVRCVICPPQSLKKVLESSGSDYDYSIISRQIIESEKILQPESVERSFAFRWFRDMLPINETTALSDAETKKLVGLPRGTQKLIFSILGYSVLSLFVPDMGEYDEPPKVVAGNIVAQTSQVKDIISAVSACFVSAGGSDLIKPKYLSLKPDESLNSQNCERRLIVIDTTAMRGRDKEQKLFQTILDDYIRYAEQKIVPVAYPDIGWLPLVISTKERDERFYNIDIQSADLSMVTEVTAVLRKLYRNALVGISESGFARLRETVIAWADEKVTERNATGAYSSRYKSMPDFLYACCRYCAAGDDELIQTVHNVMYDATGDWPEHMGGSSQKDERYLKVADLINEQLQNGIIPDEQKGDDCKDAAFRYLHKETPCVCLGEQYIDGLIKHLNISGYQAGDFIQHCTEYNILKDGQRSITVKFNGKSSRFTAIDISKM